MLCRKNVTTVTSNDLVACVEGPPFVCKLVRAAASDIMPSVWSIRAPGTKGSGFRASAKL